MKLAWTLIAIGTVLILEGTTRIFLGILEPYLLLILGGVATGWILGGFLLYKGVKRYQRFKKPH